MPHDPAWLVTGGFTDAASPGAPRGLSVHGVEPHGEPRFVAALELENPTWITRAERTGLLYVSHSARRTLSVVRLDDDGSLELVDSLDIGAMNPAHVALVDGERSVVASCFTEGAIVRVTLADDGIFAGVDRTWDVGGRAQDATHRNRLQSEAEPHHATELTSGVVLVPDRAQDVVWRIGADDVVDVAATLRPGSGPRHLALHPSGSCAYLVCELDSTLVTLRRDGDALEPIDVRTTLPAGFVGDDAAAAISIDASRDRLYVSNRGHDAVAAFDIAAQASPALIGWIPVRGRTPRFAGVLPAVDSLAIAAQGSDRVDLLSADEAAELVGDRRSFSHAAPTCVLAVPA